MLAASELAQANATKICDYAGRSAKATQAESDAWKKEASTLIRQSALALQAAQQKIDGINVTSKNLQSSMNRLEGFRSTIENLGLLSSSAVTNAMNAAEESINTARRSRDTVNTLTEQLNNAKSKAVNVLSSYSWNDDAGRLLTRAKTIGADLPEKGLISAETMLSGAKTLVNAALSSSTTVEQSMANNNIDELLTNAQDALNEFETEQTAVAFASAPGAYRPLQHALNCYSQIKGTVGGGDGLGQDLLGILSGMYIVTTPPSSDNSESSNSGGAAGNSVASNSGATTPKNPPANPPAKSNSDSDAQAKEWSGRWVGTIHYVTTASLVSVPPIDQPAVLDITQTGDTVRISSKVGGMEEIYPLKIDPLSPTKAVFSKTENAAVDGATTTAKTTVMATLEKGTISLNVSFETFTKTEFGNSNSSTKGTGTFKRGR